MTELAQSQREPTNPCFVPKIKICTYATMYFLPSKSLLAKVPIKISCDLKLRLEESLYQFHGGRSARQPIKFNKGQVGY